MTLEAIHCFLPPTMQVARTMPLHTWCYFMEIFRMHLRVTMIVWQIIGHLLEWANECISRRMPEANLYYTYVLFDRWSNLIHVWFTLPTINQQHYTFMQFAYHSITDEVNDIYADLHLIRWPSWQSQLKRHACISNRSYQPSKALMM